jgi:hypothetical protein
MQVPKNGGAPTPLVDNQSRPVSVMVDSTYVYWGTSSGLGR